MQCWSTEELTILASEVTETPDRPPSWGTVSGNVAESVPNPAARKLTLDLLVGKGLLREELIKPGSLDGYLRR